MNSTINLPPLPDLSSLPPEVSDSLVKYLNSIQSALLSISGYLDESTHHLHSSLNHFNLKSLRSLDFTIARFHKILQKHLHRELSDFEFGFALCNISHELDSLLGKSRESHNSLDALYQDAQPTTTP